MKITFLGAGVFGQALAKIAKENSHEIRYFDPYKYPDISLNDATSGSDLNIYTAPSSAASEIIPSLNKETPLICASKGFLSIQPFSDFKDFSALGGAGFAAEIEKTAQTTFTSSSTLAENIFSTETIHIEYTKDTLGIMLCGALKNVYAIGAGLYGETDSVAAPMSYLESAITEMREILSANHADPETLRLSCGAADLVLSCTKSSRNFRYGAAIKSNSLSNKSPDYQNVTVEGVNIINSLDQVTDFIVPDSAHLFKNIAKTIQETQNAAK